ncbi:DNA-binding protein [Endozoicomonas gorgoniicola]|uniref:DNA-binding protein n=1 Tax=Endozoicomonas gorgoniicola TaxID=1234144 RepID=A0ABT3N012_9GAMM|nr:DNA-binding protein [Endozoicomonas gorgoniicola]MCW7554957.1 DNA-binding protein [Endozoicomonas gorgoniicola]
MSAIKVIKTKQDHADAMERLMALMDIDHAEDSDEDNELEVLSLLIEQYESVHFPMDKPDPIDAIKFRMDQQGLTQKDMKLFLVLPVRYKKRPLSLAMIRRLHNGLDIPADVLIQRITTFLPV